MNNNNNNNSSNNSINSSMDMNSYLPTPIYVGVKFNVLFAMNCAELISHLFLDGPFSALNFLLIFKTSVLHPNLKFILLYQSACIFVRAIARAILNCARLWSGQLTDWGPSVLMAVYIQPTYIRNFIFHLLVIERMMATLFFKQYQQWRHQWFCALCLILTSAVGLLNVVIGIMCPWEPLGRSITTLTFVVTFALGLLELLAFAWIRQYNHQKYTGKALTLSQKYQLSENIRTAKQLIPCISLHFVNITFGLSQSLAGDYKLLGPDKFYYDLVGGQMVFTSSSIISFFIELSMIICHPFLKRDFLRCWKSVKAICARPFQRKQGEQQHQQHRSSSQVAPIGGVVFEEGQRDEQLCLVNIHGEPLLSIQQQQGEQQRDHFKQLELAWK